MDVGVLMDMGHPATSRPGDRDVEAAKTKLNPRDGLEPVGGATGMGLA